MDVTLTTMNNVLLLIQSIMWVESMKVIHHVLQENASTCILHSNDTFWNRKENHGILWCGHMLFFKMDQHFQEESFCWFANKYVNLTQNKSCIVKHSKKNQIYIIILFEEMHTPLKPFVINVIALTNFVT